MITGKKVEMTIMDKKIHFCNQKSEEWNYPYEWQGEGNLCTSGCGIFSLCHAAEWLTGKEQNPEEWADFSCIYGGRGDDGTDRPVLLHSLMAYKKASELGFRYEEDGLRNDKEFLFDFLLNNRGVAFCNLRVGHIVTLVAARIINGEKQVLVIDSVAESAAEKIRDYVKDVIQGTEITWPIFTRDNICVGNMTSYAGFWVDASLPKDFNLLYHI